MATINIKKTIPAKITNLVITPAVGGNILTWDKHDDDTYEVWSSTTNDVSGATLLAKVEANTFAATNLDTTLSHFFWVRAVNPVGTPGEFTKPACLGSYFNTLYFGVVESGSTSTSVNYLQAQVWYTTSAGVPTSVGPSYFTTTVVNSDFGSEPWVNPDNARVNDAAYATVTSTGYNSALLFKMSDLGVPSDATVTGVQMSLNGKSSTASASLFLAYFSNNLDFGFDAGFFPVLAANNVDETLQIGTSTSLFGLDLAGSTAATQKITSSSVIAGDVTNVSSSSSLSTSTPAISAYGTWYSSGNLTWTAADNNITQLSGHCAITVSSVTASSSEILKVWMRVRLYDNTAAAVVNAGFKTQVVYMRHLLGTNFGSTTPIFNANEVYVSGFRGLLIPGHSYSAHIEVMKEQHTGTPTCAVQVNTTWMTSSSVSVS